MRNITIYVNVDDAKLVNDLGGDLLTEDLPTVFFGEKVVFHCHFRDASLTPVIFKPSDIFHFIVDTDFDHTTPVMVFSDEYNNSDDWNEIDPNTGKISFRINCNTDIYKEKVGSTPSMNCKLELRGISNGETSIFCQNDITCKNTIDNGGAGPLPLTDYYSAEECDATFMNSNDFALPERADVQIVNGAIIKNKNNIRLLAETGTTDDLETIIGGVSGQNIILGTNDENDIITIKHGVGNILCPSGHDIVFQGDNLLMMNFDGSQWRIITFDDDVYPSFKSETNDLETYLTNVSVIECDGRLLSSYHSYITDACYQLPPKQDKLLVTIAVESESITILPDGTDEVIGIGNSALTNSELGSIITLRCTPRGWLSIDNNLVVSALKDTIVTIFDSNPTQLYNGSIKQYYGSNTDTQTHYLDLGMTDWSVEKEISQIKLDNITGVNNPTLNAKIKLADDSIVDRQFTYNDIYTRWDIDTATNGVNVLGIEIKFAI